jgi:hypothetical protein
VNTSRSVEPEPGSHRTNKSRSIAFGIERAGLISLRYPLLVGLLSIAFLIAGAFGMARIEVDDSLSQLFRSDTEEFKTFEEVTRRFPSSEFDVLIVVEGKNLLQRSSIEKLRDLVTDLQLIEGTRGIISIFSAREPREGSDLPEPLLPETLPEGAEYDRLIDRVMHNEIIRGKLLSEDGQLTLIVLALDPAVASSSRLRDVIDEINKTVANDLGNDLTARLAGVPVMKLEMRNALERDRVRYNAFGFAAGALIAIFFFRRVSFMAIAAGPPLYAIVVALGALGWLAFRLNIFLNVMTPLIMVISFSDSMQLTFAARDRLLQGESKYQALRGTMMVVGPACVLTHATAALSFIALQFSTSAAIRAFGEAGLLATLVALVAVLMLAPLLGVLLLRDEATFAAEVRGTDTAIDVLRRFCRWIAARMVARPGLYSLIAILVVGSLTLIYANLEPRYRLADQVPDREQAVDASHRLDAKLNGSNPVDVLIEFNAPLYAPATLETIAEVHAIMEKEPGVVNVWSLETLRRWLAEKQHKSDVGTLKQYVDLLPEYLTRRFIAAEQDAVLVSGRVPDIDASQLLPIIKRLDKDLDGVRARHPGYKIAVTGLSAIAARNSAAMIQKLNRGLTLEFLFVAAFVGIAFRSVVVFLATILPGIFPVVLSGTVLWLLGLGLQFSSVVALTVSFGLGLSATIHFLNRWRLEGRPDRDPALAVERATVLVGPPLILTSVVLACGFIVTIFSDLPSLRLFGWLSALAMLAALVADLLILRPTITFLSRLARRLGARRPVAPETAE